MRSVYRAIYDSIRSDILDGTYPYLSLLPTEAELCQRFDCSHSTVRRALGELAQGGYVQARQGRGVSVIWLGGSKEEEARGYATGSLETFPEVCARRGFEPATELVAFDRAVVDDALADTSGFAVGTPVVRMVRLRRADGVAVALETTYTSEVEVPGITPAIAQAGTYGYIEGELGIKILTSKRTITMARADERDRMLLGLDDNAYVAHIESHTFCSSGNQFEYIVTHQTPAFFSAHIVATRGRA